MKHSRKKLVSRGEICDESNVYENVFLVRNVIKKENFVWEKVSYG